MVSTLNSTQNGLFQKKYTHPNGWQTFLPPPPPLLTGFPRPLEPPSRLDFQAQDPPPAWISIFFKRPLLETTRNRKEVTFYPKIPVYYNFKSSLNIAGCISTFFKTDYLNDRHVFEEKTTCLFLYHNKCTR